MARKFHEIKKEWRLVHEDSLDPRVFSPEASGDCQSKYYHWLRDPLSHPDLEAMSVTQLADLPFDPRRFLRE